MEFAPEENGVLDVIENELKALENEIMGGEREGVCGKMNTSLRYHSEYCDGRMSLALMVATLVLGFVTVIINLGVIIRTVKILRQGHDKPAFFFIGNLALSDFAVGLFVVIAFLLHVTNKSDLWRQNTCMLQIGVAVTACQETVFTIVLISVDKYIYICHGLHYRSLVTRKRVWAALGVSWCLAMLVGSLPAMGLHVSWPEACNRCAFAQVISTPFAIIFFLTSVAVPLAVVVALYTILLALALRMHKARYGGSYTVSESARSSNFRLSLMSKPSRSSSTSTSSSKASRRRTKKREMEKLRNELAKRDGVDKGGTDGVNGTDRGSVRVSASSPPEGVKLIREPEEGAPGGLISPGGGESPCDSPEVVGEGRDLSGIQDREVMEEKEKEKEEEEITHQVNCKEDDKELEIESKDKGARDDSEGMTTEEDESKEEKQRQTTDPTNRDWRSILVPSKYLNKVMTETRDKVLFLKNCRAVKTVLLILTSFIATYVPFVVGSLVYSAQQEKRPCLLHLLNTLFYCAVIANSLLNPIIYAYGYREFRVRSEKFQGIFARKKPRSF